MPANVKVLPTSRFSKHTQQVDRGTQAQQKRKQKQNVTKVTAPFQTAQEIGIPIT